MIELSGDDDVVTKADLSPRERDELERKRWEEQWQGIDEITMDDINWTDIVTVSCILASTYASFEAFWPFYGFTCWWGICGGGEYVSIRLKEVKEEKKKRNRSKLMLEDPK